MPQVRTILAFGSFDDEFRKSMETAAGESGFDLALLDTNEKAVKWLGSNDPHVVLFDPGAPNAQSVCIRVRTRKALASVPIIGVAPELSESVLSDLLAAGADDVIPASSESALRLRLQGVPMTVPQAQASMGTVVVADPDHERCSVIGRALMNAGYEVHFAIERRMLEHYAASPDVKLVIASSELGPAQELVSASKAGGCAAPWIFTDSMLDVAAGAEPLDTMDGVAVISSATPPDCLLFVFNDKVGNPQAANRAHVRLLHGALVHFREEGSDQEEIGFTYNVSARGLFVRTLAVLSEKKKVELELCPPGQSSQVRLKGEVAWRRPFGPSSRAIAPTGFGVILQGGDLDAWKRAASQHAEAVQSKRRSVCNRVLHKLTAEPEGKPVNPASTRAAFAQEPSRGAPKTDTVDVRPPTARAAGQPGPGSAVTASSSAARAPGGAVSMPAATAPSQPRRASGVTVSMPAVTAGPNQQSQVVRGVSAAAPQASAPGRPTAAPAQVKGAGAGAGKPGSQPKGPTQPSDMMSRLGLTPMARDDDFPPKHQVRKEASSQPRRRNTPTGTRKQEAAPATGFAAVMQDPVKKKLVYGGAVGVIALVILLWNALGNVTAAPPKSVIGLPGPSASEPKK